MNSPHTPAPFPQADLTGVLDGSLPPGVYRWQPHAGDPGPAVGPDEGGWRSHPVSLLGVTDGAGFLDRLATELDLPGSYDRSWDGLADALTDPGWTGDGDAGRGRLLLVRGWDAFAEAAPGDAATAAEVLTAAVAFWGVRATPVTVLLS
ncbi:MULTISPECIES: barstar family protein [Streptomyces]|uniref:barstar family protein n=1 Tax=Streptomyces TaxID=1883 RepID=UPI0022488AAA|nr:barstar family protein [Streptomyces sp. JHD 1]MCX2971275.1 barstar family protein [Streptomyces sp. JHD 1]